MKVKSETLIEYGNTGVDLNISDSIVFSSSETKDAPNEVDSTVNDNIQKQSMTMVTIPGQSINHRHHHNHHCFYIEPEDVVYSEKIDCQKLIELLKTPTVLLIYAQGFPGPYL